MQPVAVPGEVVEEDRDDACAHVDGEPSVLILVLVEVDFLDTCFMVYKCKVTLTMV